MNEISLSKVAGLTSDSINSIEIIQNKSLLFACSDQEIVTYNHVTKTASQFYKSKAEDDEINNLRGLQVNQHDLLLAANGKLINIFDIQTSKQVGKFKFFKDTVNCAELSQNRSEIVAGDDTGEIKLLDLRAANTDAVSMTLKKNVGKHENICFTVKFNPLNEFEIFSGSFDCTVVKWDTRFTKASAKKPFVHKIEVPEVIAKILAGRKEDEDSSKDELAYLVSSMTPSFVHSLHFSNLKRSSVDSTVLLCGIENGICLVFDPKSCEFISCRQLQPFNRALTQFETLHGFKSSALSITEEVVATSGDGKQIECVYLSSSGTGGEAAVSIASKVFVNKIDSLHIKHGQKINCIKYSEGRLYVADTTNDLSIYDIEQNV
jgi:WD40 repeat protein